MRWPAGWRDLSPLRDSPVDCVLTADPETARRLTTEAVSKGLNVTIGAEPPSGVEVIEGDWPGTKVGPGENERMAAGPTGEPWIDSNGWRVMLAQAEHPGHRIWVDAAPAAPRLYPENYVAGLADAAAHGGRWIIHLDDRLAAGIASGDAASLGVWKKIRAAAHFFADWRWPSLEPIACIGVISDFGGENEFLSREVLNLLARANQPYRVIPLEKAAPESLTGLKAVLYVNRKPPSSALRSALNGFAEKGGLVVAGKDWGAQAARLEQGDDHPRYQVRHVGKGRVAVALQAEEDPYLMVQDAVVLLSHRHDLIRFWNGGAVRACLSASADQRTALLQTVFYANARAGDATVRVAGKYRAARLYTSDAPPRDVPLLPEKDAVELHLPAVGPYGAVQLDF